MLKVSPLPVRAPVALAGLLLASAVAAAAQGLPPTDSAARGAAIVADRRLGLCLLCHAAPLPDPQFHGTLGPPLHGVGARLNGAELRERLVNPKRFNPNTVMPAYGPPVGLQRVAPAFANQPVLTPAQVDDVVAYLETLK